MSSRTDGSTASTSERAGFRRRDRWRTLALNTAGSSHVPGEPTVTWPPWPPEEPSLALAGAIDLVESPVHAIVRGTLRGAAVAVLCAAQQRAADQHTMFVLLSPQFSGEGTAAVLATLADQHERQMARLRDLIVRATGRTTPEVAADLEPGRVLGADEAKDYGLVSQLL